MDDNSSYDENSDFEDFKKKCNWCFQYSRLVKGRNFCFKCESEAFRVCKRCKRPFPNARFFEFDETRCNTCFAKYTKEKEKRLAKKETPSTKQEYCASPPSKGSTSTQITGVLNKRSHSQISTTNDASKISKTTNNKTKEDEPVKTSKQIKKNKKPRRAFIPLYFEDSSEEDCSEEDCAEEDST